MTSLVDGTRRTGGFARRVRGDGQERGSRSVRPRLEPRWKWEETDPDRSGSSGDLAKLFKNESVKNPGIFAATAPSEHASLMAREVIQNSSDAASELSDELGDQAPEFEIAFEFESLKDGAKDSFVAALDLSSIAAAAGLTPPIRAGVRGWVWTAMTFSITFTTRRRCGFSRSWRAERLACMARSTVPSRRCIWPSSRSVTPRRPTERAALTDMARPASFVDRRSGPSWPTRPSGTARRPRRDPPTPRDDVLGSTRS